MSETISQLPPGNLGALGDLIPLTQGSLSPGTGTSKKLTSGKVLGSNGAIYAGDPSYGVQADGATDDTIAWVNALAAASARGADVIAPLGVSVFSNFTIPPNVRVIGRNIHATSGTPILGSVLKSTTGGSLPAITMGLNSQLQDIMVQASSLQTCVNVNAGQAWINNCDIFGGRYGVDFAIQGVSQPSLGGGSGSAIQNSRIHDCSVYGVNSPIGSHITNCTFTSNGTSIVLNPLCNGNRILGNTFVRSTAWHIFCAASNIAIIGNSFSQSGSNAIYLSGARYASVCGNDIGMGGASQAGSPSNTADSNIYLANCTGVTVTGNTSWTGTPTTNYICPFYAIYDGGGNISCLITGNILGYHNNSSGTTSGPINTTATFNLAASLNASIWGATS